MLFHSETARGIAAGRITLAFRRWGRARVRLGTRLRTAVGVIEVTGVEATDVAGISNEDAEAAGYGSAAELRAEIDGYRDREGQLYRVRLRYAGEDERIALRENATFAPGELQRVLDRLKRMDSTRPEGWTARTLKLVRDHPAERAASLAREMGRETLSFKSDVRRLKELGLTESLDVGYRLSPRGVAVLAVLEAGTDRSESGSDRETSGKEFG